VVLPLFERKVQLKSWISKETNRKFRIFVAQKNHIFIKGQFSFEVEQALIHYMDKERPMEFSEDSTRTHSGTNMSRSRDQQQRNLTDQKAEQLIEGISTWVMKNYNLLKQPTEIAPEILRRAIIAVKGVQDRRSINAAIELLKANGLLKGVTDKLYEIPYNMTERPPPAPPIERGTFREV
jgi:hypothetical protein